MRDRAPVANLSDKAVVLYTVPSCSKLPDDRSVPVPGSLTHMGCKGERSGERNVQATVLRSRVWPCSSCCIMAHVRSHNAAGFVLSARRLTAKWVPS